MLKRIDRIPRPIDARSNDGIELKRPLRGCIEFNDVHFAYSTCAGAKLLNGLTWAAELGENVALVGHCAGLLTATTAVECANASKIFFFTVLFK